MKYIQIPTMCPCCNHSTEIQYTDSSKFLICTNPNCPAKLLAKFTHFVSRNCANIDGLSGKTLEFLINKGWLHSFKDIYHLTDYKDKWERCEGFGKASVKKILESIETSRTVKLGSFIAALGIDGIGTAASKTIANAFNNDFDAFFEALETNYDWSKLSDFGEITAQNIADFGAENGDMVRELAKEMRFIQKEKKEIKDNPFIGKSICCTGKLEHFTRDSINEKIVELGAKVASGVTSKTDFLINNDPNSNSSKNNNARKFGTKIITEEEFLNLIGG